MSDRPNNRQPDDQENRSGWRSPESPGGWRVPKQATAPGERHAWRAPDEAETEADSEGWRVPTLPRNLDVSPDNQGEWHLPQPTDTTYTPEDESVIASEAATADSDAPTETKPDEAAAAPPTDEGATALSPQEVLPFEGESTNVLPSDETSTQLEPIDEDEDDSFSMSELVALASLVDNVPSVEVKPAVATSEVPAVPVDSVAAPAPASEGEAAGTSDQPLDPAEYARQQLARLQQQQAPQAAEA